MVSTYDVPSDNPKPDTKTVPTGHPSAADKPIEERVPWEIPPSGTGEPLPPAEPPADPAVEGADA